MASHVRKGDTVEIMAGDHKGSTGRVMKVVPEKDCVYVYLLVFLGGSF